MFESIVADIIAKYIGEYIKNLSSQQLKVNIFSGDVVLKNLEIKGEALQSFKLPLHVYKGIIGTLNLKIPWTNIKSQPVILEIDSICLYAIPQTGFDYNEEEEKKKLLELKKKKLEKYELIRAFKEGGITDQKSHKQDTFMSSVMSKILNNIQIKINSFHLRYEEVRNGKVYALGISFGSLNAFPTDQFWNKSRYDDNSQQQQSTSSLFKFIELCDFSIYLNSDDRSVKSISENNYTLNEFQTTMRDMIGRHGDLGSHTYILKPITVTLKIELNRNLNMDERVPKMKVFCQFEKVSFVIEENQYQTILKLLTTIGNYAQEIKYLKYRPKQRPTKDPRAWWRYAGDVYRESIREKIQQRSWNFIQKRRHNRKEYINLFKKLQSVEWLDPITEKEVGRIKEMEEQLSFEDIIYFRSLARRELAMETAIADSKKGQFYATTNRNKSFFSGFWHKDTAEPRMNIQLTKEQQEEIYKSMEYDEIALNASIEMPASYVEHIIEVQINSVEFSIIGSTDHEPLLLESNLDNINFKLSQRAQGFKLELDLESFNVLDKNVNGTNSIFPYVITSNPTYQRSQTSLLLDSSSNQEAAITTGIVTGDQQHQNLFHIIFESKPIQSSYDYSLSLILNSLEIILNKNQIERLVEFATPKENVNLFSLSSAAIEEFLLLKEMTIFQLREVINHHKTIDLFIDAKAPTLIIPEYSDRQDTHLIVVDLGNFRMQSDISKKPRKTNSMETPFIVSEQITTLTDVSLNDIDDSSISSSKADNDNSNFSNGSNNSSYSNTSSTTGTGTGTGNTAALSKEESLKISDLYDHYRAYFSSIKILLVNNKDKWYAANESATESRGEQQLYRYQLIEEMSINLHIQSCIEPNELSLALFKVSGVLPNVKINISDETYLILYHMVKTLVQDSNSSATTTAYNQIMGMYQQSSQQQDTIVEVNPNEIKLSDAYRQVLSKRKLFEGDFTLQTVAIDVYKTHNSSTSDSPNTTTSSRSSSPQLPSSQKLIQIQIGDLKVSVKKKTYDFVGELLLGYVQVEDCQEKYQQFHSLITSQSRNINVNEKKLISITYEMIDSNSPNFKGIDTIIHFNFGELNFNYNPRSMATIISFLDYCFEETFKIQDQFIINSSDSSIVPTTNITTVQSSPVKLNQSNSLKQSQFINNSTNSTNSTTTTTTKSSGGVIKAYANIYSLSISLNEDGKELGLFSINSFVISDCLISGRSLEIEGYLASITIDSFIDNPNEGFKILTPKNPNVHMANFKYKSFGNSNSGSNGGVDIDSFDNEIELYLQSIRVTVLVDFILKTKQLIALPFKTVKYDSLYRYQTEQQQLQQQQQQEQQEQLQHDDFSLLPFKVAKSNYKVFLESPQIILSCSDDISTDDDRVIAELGSIEIKTTLKQTSIDDNGEDTNNNSNSNSKILWEVLEANLYDMNIKTFKNGQYHQVLHNLSILNTIETVLCTTSGISNKCAYLPFYQYPNQKRINVNISEIKLEFEDLEHALIYSLTKDVLNKILSKSSNNSSGGASLSNSTSSLGGSRELLPPPPGVVPPPSTTIVENNIYLKDKMNHSIVDTNIAIENFELKLIMQQQMDFASIQLNGIKVNSMSCKSSNSIISITSDSINVIDLRDSSRHSRFKELVISKQSQPIQPILNIKITQYLQPTQQDQQEWSSCIELKVRPCEFVASIGFILGIKDFFLLPFNSTGNGSEEIPLLEDIVKLKEIKKTKLSIQLESPKVILPVSVCYGKVFKLVNNSNSGDDSEIVEITNYYTSADQLFNLPSSVEIEHLLIKASNYQICVVDIDNDNDSDIKYYTCAPLDMVIDYASLDSDIVNTLEMMTSKKQPTVVDIVVSRLYLDVNELEYQFFCDMVSQVFRYLDDSPLLKLKKKNPFLYDILFHHQQIPYKQSLLPIFGMGIHCLLKEINIELKGSDDSMLTKFANVLLNDVDIGIDMATEARPKKMNISGSVGELRLHDHRTDTLVIKSSDPSQSMMVFNHCSYQSSNNNIYFPANQLFSSLLDFKFNHLYAIAKDSFILRVWDWVVLTLTSVFGTYQMDNYRSSSIVNNGSGITTTNSNSGSTGVSRMKMNVDILEPVFMLPNSVTNRDIEIRPKKVEIGNRFVSKSSNNSTDISDVLVIRVAEGMICQGQVELSNIFDMQVEMETIEPVVSDIMLMVEHDEEGPLPLSKYTIKTGPFQLRVDQSSYFDFYSSFNQFMAYHYEFDMPDNKQFLKPNHSPKQQDMMTMVYMSTMEIHLDQLGCIVIQDLNLENLIKTRQELMKVDGIVGSLFIKDTKNDIVLLEPTKQSQWKDIYKSNSGGTRLNQDNFFMMFKYTTYGYIQTDSFANWDTEFEFSLKSINSVIVPAFITVPQTMLSVLIDPLTTHPLATRYRAIPKDKLNLKYQINLLDSRVIVLPSSTQTPSYDTFISIPTTQLSIISHPNQMKSLGEDTVQIAVVQMDGIQYELQGLQILLCHKSPTTQHLSYHSLFGDDLNLSIKQEIISNHTQIFERLQLTTDELNTADLFEEESILFNENSSSPLSVLFRSKYTFNSSNFHIELNESHYQFIFNLFNQLPTTTTSNTTTTTTTSSNRIYYDSLFYFNIGNIKINLLDNGNSNKSQVEISVEQLQVIQKSEIVDSVVVSSSLGLLKGLNIIDQRNNIIQSKYNDFISNISTFHLTNTLKFNYSNQKLDLTISNFKITPIFNLLSYLSNFFKSNNNDNNSTPSKEQDKKLVYQITMIDNQLILPLEWESKNYYISSDIEEMIIKNYLDNPSVVTTDNQYNSYNSKDEMFVEIKSLSMNSVDTRINDQLCSYRIVKDLNMVLENVFYNYNDSKPLDSPTMTSNIDISTIHMLLTIEQYKQLYDTLNMTTKSYYEFKHGPYPSQPTVVSMLLQSIKDKIQSKFPSIKLDLDDIDVGSSNSSGVGIDNSIESINSKINCNIQLMKMVMLKQHSLQFQQQQQQQNSSNNSNINSTGHNLIIGELLMEKLYNNIEISNQKLKVDGTVKKLVIKSAPSINGMPLLYREILRSMNSNLSATMERDVNNSGGNNAPLISFTYISHYGNNADREWDQESYVDIKSLSIISKIATLLKIKDFIMEPLSTPFVSPPTNAVAVPLGKKSKLKQVIKMDSWRLEIPASEESLDMVVIQFGPLSMTNFYRDISTVIKGVSTIHSVEVFDIVLPKFKIFTHRLNGTLETLVSNQVECNMQIERLFTIGNPLLEDQRTYCTIPVLSLLLSQDDYIFMYNIFTGNWMFNDYQSQVRPPIAPPVPIYFNYRYVYLPLDHVEQMRISENQFSSPEGYINVSEWKQQTMALTIKEFTLVMNPYISPLSNLIMKNTVINYTMYRDGIMQVDTDIDNAQLIDQRLDTKCVFKEILTRKHPKEKTSKLASPSSSLSKSSSIPPHIVLKYLSDPLKNRAFTSIALDHPMLFVSPNSILPIMNFFTSLSDKDKEQQENTNNVDHPIIEQDHVIPPSQAQENQGDKTKNIGHSRFYLKVSKPKLLLVEDETQKNSQALVMKMPIEFHYSKTPELNQTMELKASKCQVFRTTPFSDHHADSGTTSSTPITNTFAFTCIYILFNDNSQQTLNIVFQPLSVYLSYKEIIMINQLIKNLSVSPSVVPSSSSSSSTPNHHLQDEIYSDEDILSDHDDDYVKDIRTASTKHKHYKLNEKDSISPPSSPSKSKSSSTTSNTQTTKSKLSKDKSLSAPIRPDDSVKVMHKTRVHLEFLGRVNFTLLDESIFLKDIPFLQITMGDWYADYWGWTEYSFFSTNTLFKVEVFNQKHMAFDSLVEQFDLNLQVLQADDPKLKISVKSDDPVNINISHPFIHALANFYQNIIKIDKENEMKLHKQQQQEKEKENSGTPDIEISNTDHHGHHHEEKKSSFEFKRAHHRRQSSSTNSPTLVLFNNSNDEPITTDNLTWKTIPSPNQLNSSNERNSLTTSIINNKNRDFMKSSVNLSTLSTSPSLVGLSQSSQGGVVNYSLSSSNNNNVNGNGNGSSSSHQRSLSNSNSPQTLFNTEGNHQFWVVNLTGKEIEYYVEELNFVHSFVIDPAEDRKDSSHKMKKGKPVTNFIRDYENSDEEDDEEDDQDKLNKPAKRVLHKIKDKEKQVLELNSVLFKTRDFRAHGALDAHIALRFIDADDGETQWIHGVSINQVGDNFYFPPFGNRANLIVCEVGWNEKNENKIATLRSPVIIKNSTNTLIEILLLTSIADNQDKSQPQLPDTVFGPIRPDENFYIPVDFWNFNTTISIRPYQQDYSWDLKDPLNLCESTTWPDSHFFTSTKEVMEENYHDIEAGSSVLVPQPASSNNTSINGDPQQQQVDLNQSSMSSFSSTIESMYLATMIQSGARCDKTGLLSTTLVITPPLIIENALYCDIDIRIINHSNKKKNNNDFLKYLANKPTTRIKSGEQLPWYLCIGTAADTGITLSLAGLGKDQFFTLQTINPSPILNINNMTSFTQEIPFYCPVAEGSNDTYTLTLKIDHRFEGGCHIATLYCNNIIYNHTMIPFLLKPSQLIKSPVSLTLKTNETPVMLSHDKFVLYHPSFPNIPSKELDIVLGKEDITEIQLQGRDIMKWQFKVVVSTGDGVFFRSRRVNIYPRFVLINKLPLTISYAQLNKDILLMMQDNLELEPDSQTPFHWFNGKEEQLLSITISQGDKWAWSGGLRLDTVGTHYLKLRHMVDNDLEQSVRVEIRDTNESTIILFYSNDPQNLPFHIKNETEYPISIHQKHPGSKKYTLQTNHDLYYTWDHPFGERQILVQVENTTTEINLNKIKVFKPIKLPNNKIIFPIIRAFNGTTRELTFSSSYTQSRELDTLEFAFDISFSNIGFSLIDDMPQELVYANFKDLHFWTSTSNLTHTTWLIIGDVQIDNQHPDTDYEVLLWCDKKRDSQALPFLEYSSVKLNKDNLEYYDLIAFYLNEIYIQLDDKTLVNLHSFYSKLPFDKFSTSTTSQQQDQSTSSNPTSPNPTTSHDNNNQPSIPLTTFYIKWLIVAELKIYLTFSVSRDGYLRNYNKIPALRLLIPAMGKSLGQLENAPLTIQQLGIKNIFSNRTSLNQLLLSHYTKQMKRQIHIILGSSNIFGSPVVFFNNISTGMTEAIEEPIKGSIQLMKRILYAAANSSSKLFGTISNGFAVWSLDESYLRKRDADEKIKAKHIGHGLYLGAKGLTIGIVDGITGIVRHPVQGAMQEGVFGFLKGLGKGVAGIAVKPVTGVFDLASKTSEGIRNNTNIHPERFRLRIPRFINPRDPIKEYSVDESEGNFLLKQNKELIAKNEEVGHNAKEFEYKFHVALPDCTFLLTSFSVICLSKKGSYRWSFPLTEISRLGTNVAKAKLNIYLKNYRSFGIFSQLRKKITIYCPNELILIQLDSKIRSCLFKSYDLDLEENNNDDKNMIVMVNK